MEAAGVMNEIPVGNIRGVCDYGDERKNKDWQPYAAAMAAAFAKAVLSEISPKSAAQLAVVKSGKLLRLETLTMLAYLSKTSQMKTIHACGTYSSLIPTMTDDESSAQRAVC
jgi:hypothetical protein